MLLLLTSFQSKVFDLSPFLFLMHSSLLCMDAVPNILDASVSCELDSMFRLQMHVVMP